MKTVMLISLLLVMPQFLQSAMLVTTKCKVCLGRENLELYLLCSETVGDLKEKIAEESNVPKNAVHLFHQSDSSKEIEGSKKLCDFKRPEIDFTAEIDDLGIKGAD